MSASHRRITELLAAAQDGDAVARDELFRIVYDDLRQMAQARLRQAGAGDSLEPSVLVHEAFLRMVKLRARYDGRGHFFAVASRAMVRVLLDHYRAAAAAKRGGGWVQVTISAAEGDLAVHPEVEIPAYVEALEALDRLDPRTAEVVRLRSLWGLTVSETAEAMAISPSTVDREWRFACKWLARRVRGGP